MELTDENLRQAIKALDRQKVNPNDYVMWLRPADRFLGPKYRGKGRPRNSDYYYRKINWPESLKEKRMVYEEEV